MFDLLSKYLYGMNLDYVMVYPRNNKEVLSLVYRYVAYIENLRGTTSWGAYTIHGIESMNIQALSFRKGENGSIFMSRISDEDFVRKETKRGKKITSISIDALLKVQKGKKKKLIL